MLVFRPRGPVAAPPPPTQPSPQQPPGTALVIRGPFAEQSLYFAGGCYAARGGTPPTVPQPPPAAVVARGPENAPPDLLAGRVTGGQFGVAQPVDAPTRAVVARAEDRVPEPGHLVRSGSRAPQDYLPAARPAVALVREVQAPAPGAVTVGRVGFGVPGRPVRPMVFRAEAQAPAPGALLAGKPPPPNLTPQQLATVARIVRAEEPPPYPGFCSATGRFRPLVPSDRKAPRAVVARAEEPTPFAGAIVRSRLWFGPNPPARFTAVIARAEEPRPVPGRAITGKAPPPDLVPQQQPGTVRIVPSVAPPQPFAGWVWISTGRLAGAIAPSLPGATIAKLFQRADASVRSFKRPTNVSTLTYQTRTKTPSQILAAVFDFSNQPEIVGGATIVSAVVTGPGATPLTGLVAGTPAVLTSAAVVDSLGSTVAAGKGVQVALAGGGNGDDVIVECAATLSTGSIAVVQGKVSVRNAV